MKPFLALVPEMKVSLMGTIPLYGVVRSLPVYSVKIEEFSFGYFEIYKFT